MQTLKGPALFLAQYLSDEAPFDSLDSIAAWASGLGFHGVQVPCGDRRIFDLEQAATSKSYCDEWRGQLEQHGLQVTELSSHLRGQMVAVHPAYDELFDAFAPDALRGKPKQRTAWAVEQVKLCVSASANLGLDTMATFSGSLAWPYLYPWPPRPAGLIEEAFAELARRWLPILNHADSLGVNCAFELHPSEDLFDGATFERFLDAVDQHPRAQILFDPSHLVLQGIDPLAFIDLYHERIKAFHVKDAEFVQNGRTGAYGGYLNWPDRAGRFRSLGDGQIDFGAVFTALAKYDFQGWAVLEWECAFKDGVVGAREGAEFIRQHIVQVAKGSFDDFAATGVNAAANQRLLGLDR